MYSNQSNTNAWFAAQFSQLALCFSTITCIRGVCQVRRIRIQSIKSAAAVAPSHSIRQVRVQKMSLPVRCPVQNVSGIIMDVSCSDQSFLHKTRVGSFPSVYRMFTICLPSLYP